jgi:hypothetical protein
MSEAPVDHKPSFPGGYDVGEIIVAVKLAEMRHLKSVPRGEVDGELVERFLKELVARHPEMFPVGDPYDVRSQELFNERRSLLNSHLRFSWFALAYWSYGLLAVRSGISIAEYENLKIFLNPVLGALRELGVRVSEEECLNEVERFLPLKVSEKTVETSAYAFLSFVRFLHHAALRRRQLVTPGLTLPGVCLAFAHEDAEQAGQISAFLASHGVSLMQEPDEISRPARLLVLLSHEAIQSEDFWRRLATWKARPVTPMVVCLMPRAELFREPPFDTWNELWTWLGENFAVEFSGKADPYDVLLTALDQADPKQWWWNRDDAIEVGLALDVLGTGLPRPPTRREATRPSAKPYPFAFNDTHLSACLLASERKRGDKANGRDAPYVDRCDSLLKLRQKPNGEPYALPWFMLIYRVSLAFADRLPEYAYSEADATQAEYELRSALFALGIATQPSEVPAFLGAFARLPWTGPLCSVAAVDERTIAFIILIDNLAQAALARRQRMRLQHRARPCFISYARSDEGFTRELVAVLEAKGTDVWCDFNALTLGTPLDESLRSAVGDATVLFLIATTNADRNKYVRLEVETAIRQGLRIVPIAPDGRLPPGLKSLLASAPSSFEPFISAPDADRANAFASALARLERSPEEQLRWLQSQASHGSLWNHLTQARL